METKEPSKFKSRLKKLGVAGIIFFTVKGLLWLLIPLLLAKGCLG